jgi:formate dehydrogenase major subunit
LPDVSYAKLDEMGSVQWPCNEKAPEGTPIMHIGGFVRGKGKFMMTEYVPTDERTGPRFPLLLTTGRILSQYNVGAQTRRTDNIVWHDEDVLEIHPHDAEAARRARWRLGEARQPCRGHDAARSDHRPCGAGRRLHHLPSSRDAGQRRDHGVSDWATNCPEYKVTAVQISPSNGPSEWQRDYAAQADRSRRIAKVAAE